MRIALASCAALLAIALPGNAQEKVDAQMNARIRAEGLERSHVVEMFNMLTNVIGPRLTGSPAYKRAADWARGQLASWGLANTRLESFEFGRGWTLEKLTLEMTQPRYFPLIGYPEAWMPSTRGVLEGAPVYLGDKTADQIRAMGEQLRGAIVLAVQPQAAFIKDDRPQPADTEARVRIGAPPGVGSRSTTPSNQVMPLLREFDAGVLLRPNQGEHGTIFVLGNRNTQNDAIPSIVLAAEHYNMIARMVQSGNAPRLRVELQSRYHEQDRNSYNVIAEIPGTDPALKDEIVLIGAHLDSWHSSPGATDNADGAAEMMEAMRILKAVGAAPRRTIRLALWGGEEQGLLGSRAYVSQHLDTLPAHAAAREKFYVYLNDDPGTGPVYGFYLEQNASIKPIFDAWLEPFKDLGARKNVIDGIGNTDHLSFTRARLPGFNTIKDYVDYDVRTHHTNTDFYERVREQDLKQSAIIMASFAWHTAMRDGKLPTRPAS